MGCCIVFFQAEDGIRYLVRSRGLGDVYKRQDLAEGVRGVNMTFHDLTRQVRRTLISPCWTGMVNDGRAYAAWCINVERLIPVSYTHLTLPTSDLV